MKIIKSLSQFRSILEKEENTPKESNELQKNSDSKKKEEPELSEVEKLFLTNVVNLFTNIVKLNDIIERKVVKIEESLIFESEINNPPTKKQHSEPAKPITSNDKNSTGKGSVKQDNLIRKDETQAIAVWKKILKANSLPDFKNCIVGIKNIVNKKSGLKSSDIIKIGNNILENRKTMGKPLEIDDLLKENFSWSDYMNKIPKGVAIFLKYIIGLRNEMGIVGAFGEASEPIKVIIKSYTLMQQKWEKLKRESRLLNKKKTTPKEEVEETEEEKGKKEEKDKEEVELSDDLKDLKSKVEKSKRIKNLPKDEIIKILDQNKDVQSEVEFEYKDGKKEKISVSKAIELLKKELIGKEERIVSRYSNKIFEGGLTIQYPTGTAGVDFGVKKIWEEHYKEIDAKGSFNMSQNDKEEMAKLLNEGANNLSLDVSEKPDPIVRIANIFSRAHELYFNKFIPSGRPNGRVSLQTLSEYIKLGDGQLPTPETQVNGGPYAYEKTFKIWRKGVNEILEDQKLRPVLANMKFIVPGAEDFFNPPSEKKESNSYKWDYNKERLFEYKDDKDTKIEGESHGQSLIDFMLKMLEVKKLDDFDSLRSNLLRKYFGLESKELKDKLNTPSERNNAPKEDEIDNNHLMWFGFKNWNALESSMGSDFEDVFIAVILEYDNTANPPTKEKCLFFCRVESVSSGTANVDNLYFCDDFKNGAKELVKELEDDDKTFDNFKNVNGVNTKERIKGEEVKNKRFKGKIDFKRDEVKINYLQDALRGSNTAPKILQDSKFKPLEETSGAKKTDGEKFWMYILKEIESSSTKKGWERYEIYKMS
jgi:hypothetical protein